MSEKVGVTGSQLRRWREMKNLTRAQLICLLGPHQRTRSTDSIKRIEEAPNNFIPQWLIRPLGRGKVYRVTIECHMDLFDWAQDDLAGGDAEPEPHHIIEDVTSADEPVAVDVDEASFIAHLLRRQGYDVQSDEVKGWLRGKTPPVEVGTSLKRIKQNLGYLVRAAQAEHVVRGVFSDATFASIAKDDSFDRRLLTDIELKRAQGERKVELEHEMRLPRRYISVLEQMAHAVRLNTAELCNLWLERSNEALLQVTRIKTKYDELGIVPRSSRRNLFKFALGRSKMVGGNREARTTDEVKDGD